MIKKPNDTPCLFSNLPDMPDQSHPLYQLAGKIGWGKFEMAFQPLYCQDNGRPGKPIRLMCDLLILKHFRNLSDESSVEQWSEDAYYQYFCGMREFTPSAPCASSEPVHFRNRIGEEGVGLMKEICHDQRLRNHPKNRKKAFGADRRLRTIAGRLVRELKRNLKGNHDYDRLLELFETILSQRRNGRKKICSIHEPEVQCISKGKGHKKYGFGNKVSIIRSATGIILVTMSFRNDHDGYAIESSLEQAERLTGRKIKVLAGDGDTGAGKESTGRGLSFRMCLRNQTAIIRD